jgi:prolyl oligopeptidase
MRTIWIPNCYPPAYRSDHVDVYKSEKYGSVSIPDPYQWLERNDEETDKWTTAQAALTKEYLGKYAGGQQLEDEIRKNMDYAKVKAVPLNARSLLGWVDLFYFE